MNNSGVKLAVLIDADNVPAKYATALFEEISSLGEASIRRIYGDFSDGMPQGWKKENLAELAIIAHQQFSNTAKKNSSDIALVIDAMDILHSGRFDGFVLVSSDSDFTRLASRIREHGLDVYGFGERKTPKSFCNACKRFIFVENLVENDEIKPAIEKSEPPSKVIPWVKSAMRAVDPEQEWIALSPLGGQLNAAHPDFDTRNFGCRNLSTLLEKSGEFETKDFAGTIKTRWKKA